jgi:hypothetical protein
MPCVSPAVAPPPVLMPHWETLVILTSTLSNPLDLDAYLMSLHPPVGFIAQLTNRSLLGFESQTKEPSWWFWGSNHQTVAVSFEAQIRRNRRHLFGGQTGENRRHRFWGQTRENRPSGFEAKPLTSRRPWFWGSTKKLTLLISTYTIQTAHGATRPSQWLITIKPINWPLDFSGWVSHTFGLCFNWNFDFNLLILLCL